MHSADIRKIEGSIPSAPTIFTVTPVCEGSTMNTPWDKETVEALNKYQHSGQFHPYTCGNDECRANNHHVNGDVLVATEEGWMCMKCDYTQNWAHQFTVES